MSISLRHNAVSMASANELGRNSNQLGKTINRVSSGNRIASVADDSAGSAVSVHLSTKATSTLQGIRNANDGIAIIQTSEAAIKEAIGIVERSRELAVQASSQPLNDTEREYVDNEYQQLASEVDRIASSLNFNGAGIGGGQTFDVQVGTNESSTSRITITSHFKYLLSMNI